MKFFIGFILVANSILGTSRVTATFPTVYFDSRSTAAIAGFGPVTDNSLVWVKVTNGTLPKGAVVGGMDDDGQTLYVCRGDDEHGMAPGKFKLTKGSNTGRAYIPWGGTEHVTDNFQILTVSDPSTLTWTSGAYGAVSPLAVVGGRDENNDVQFIGRFYFWKSKTTVVGKIHPRYQHSYIAYNGQEYWSNTYEVLTLSTVLVDKVATICEEQKFNLTCNNGTTINIIKAEYGRLDSFVCNRLGNVLDRHDKVATVYVNNNCTTPFDSNGDHPPTKYARDSCNGNQFCDLPASNGNHGDPCPGTFKYMTVLYNCTSAQFTTRQLH